MAFTSRPRAKRTVTAPPLRRNLDSRTKLVSRPSTPYDTFRRQPSKRLLSTSPDKGRKGKKGFVSKMVSTETLLFFSFWIFGTAITMQFGVVVTAAADLVGNSAPPGLILFAYTLPSIMVRMFFPYIKFPDISVSSLGNLFRSKPMYYTAVPTSKNTPPPTPLTPPLRKLAHEVDYATRLTVCATSSFLGLQLLAWCDNVGTRVLGIGLASLSSNLGDMSFFQLATRYPSMSTQSMGGYAAGSGAAGLIGAFMYTMFTISFGVRPATVLSGVGAVPMIMLVTYFLMLPSPGSVQRETGDVEPEVDSCGESVISSLKLSDKLRLVTPMIWGYMAPLAILMFLENVTTQGILPTLIWTLPFSPRFSAVSILSSIFHTARDFYPTFFTIYQLSIFFGRTSITLFRIPGGNSGSSSAYYILCFVELLCFFVMLSQSFSMAASTLPDPDAAVKFSPIAIAVFIFIMGLCGGLGMSNTYWRVSKKPLPPAVWAALDSARTKGSLAKDEGVMTPVANVDSEEVEEEEEEDYFFQRERSRPRLRAMVSRLGPSELTMEGKAMLLRRQGGRRGVERSMAEEMAVREFLISTIALPDTVAIMVASCVSLWLQPKLCEMQVAGGRSYCARG